MKFVQDFKAFLLRGSVNDLAVGMVVGTAFTGMVKSLVDDMIMPPIGLLIGGIDFSNLFVVLKEGEKIAAPYATLKAAQDAGAVTINIGLFINTLISLVIVGFAIFIVIKAISKLQRSEETPPPETKECTECCSQIAIAAKRCPHCTSAQSV